MDSNTDRELDKLFTKYTARNNLIKFDEDKYTDHELYLAFKRNEDLLKEALLAWSKQRERAALEKLLKELTHPEDKYPMNDTFVVPVDYIEETIEDQITSLGRGNDE